MNKRRSLSGFTLIELLVVIGIIALMISILLPTIKRVQAAARGAACLANLRNLSQNISLYMVTWKGEFPATAAQQDGLFTSNARAGQNTQFDVRLATCPEYAVRRNANERINQSVNFSNIAGYGFNPWLSWVRSAPNSKRVLPSRIKNSSETICFGDVLATDANGWNVTGGTPLYDPFQLNTTNQPLGSMLLTTPVFQGRHAGRGALLWMDGHASLQRPIELPADPALYVSGYPGLLKSVSWYRQNNLGYAVRSAEDLTSLQAVYYFVFNKDGIPTNNPALYRDSLKKLW